MSSFTEAIEQRLKILQERITLNQIEIDKYSKIKGYYILPFQTDIALAQAGIDELEMILTMAIPNYGK